MRLNRTDSISQLETTAERFIASVSGQGMLSLAGNVLGQADRNLKFLCALDFHETGADEIEGFFLLNGSVWSGCAKSLKAFRTLNGSATADGAAKFFNGHWLAYAGEQKPV